MDPETPHDGTVRSFLSFAEALTAKIREWEEDAGPPLFDDIEVRFTENGRRGDIVKKLDYERLFRRRWDSSIGELGALARECVRLHLAGGIIKPPQLSNSEGKPIVAPSLDEILPSLVWAVARPVLVTLDNLQKLDVTESDLLATYQKFAEGWRMEDVPQVATVPILNLVSASNLRISPSLDRIIDLTIALESLLLADASDELKYRLALRGAALLRKHRDPREVNALLLALYDVRSAIVHEGKHLYEPNKAFKRLGTSLPGVQPKDLPSVCEELTRQVLRTYIARLLTGARIKQINKALDSDIVGNLATVPATAAVE